MADILDSLFISSKLTSSNCVSFQLWFVAAYRLKILAWKMTSRYQCSLSFMGIITDSLENRSVFLVLGYTTYTGLPAWMKIWLWSINRPSLNIFIGYRLIVWVSLSKWLNKLLQKQCNLLFGHIPISCVSYKLASSFDIQPPSDTCIHVSFIMCMYFTLNHLTL